VKRIKLNEKMVWQNGKYLKSNKSSVKLPDNRIGFEVAPGEWSFVAEY
jgi:hypothetical protein